MLACGLVLHKGVSQAFLVLSWHSSPISLFFLLFLFSDIYYQMFFVSFSMSCHPGSWVVLSRPLTWCGFMIFLPPILPRMYTFLHYFSSEFFSHWLPSFWPYSQGPVCLHTIGKYVSQTFSIVFFLAGFFVPHISIVCWPRVWPTGDIVQCVNK